MSTCDQSQGSQDSDDKHRQQIVASGSGHQTYNTNLGLNPRSSAPGGYFDAEKCRAFIANRTRVSKIDRFASQINKALEVENGNFNRMGLQRHRQDRILWQRKPSARNKTIDSRSSLDNKLYSINTDLLYGPGAQLVQLLFNQCPPTFSKHIKRKAPGTKSNQNKQDDEFSVAMGESNHDSNEDLSADPFDPTIFVKNFEESIRSNLSKSKAVISELNNIRHLFERLASEHHDNVDLVCAAEEERLAATVVRRSAYNLSLAANKATSMPVHVCADNELQ